MGRGTLYLTIANIVFFLSGFIIHFGLGRHLGPEDYGILGVMLSLMSVATLLLTSGFPRASSKYIAEDNTRLSSIVKDSRRIQFLLSILVFALYFSLAGAIANLLHDSQLTPYIRISAFAIPAYAFFSIYNTGYLNGLRHFGKQAKAHIGSSLAKVGIVFILVFLGLGVKGAIIGYILATLVGLLLAWKYLGKIKKGSPSFEWSKLIGFGVPASLFAVMTLLLMSIDLLAVKAISGGAAETGYYTAANTIARVPYYAFGGLVAALFPSISMSTSRENSQLTGDYINRSMRYMLMLLIPGVLLLSATSTDLISLVYSSEYLEAAKPLKLLVFGLGFLTVFGVLASVLMGAGKPHIALGMALPIVAMDVALNIMLIPKYGLIGAAAATTLAALIGMGAAAICVWRYFKTLVSVKSVIKFCLASLVIYVLALQISLPLLFLPLVYVGLFALYAGILWLMKELGREDIKTFKRILPLGVFGKAEEKE